MAKPLWLQILWWAQVVVGARVFLFFAPVMINKWRAGNLSAYIIGDVFLWFAAFASLLYFLVGVASLLGHKWWRVFHLIACVVVIALTFSLWNFSRQVLAPWPLVYLLPAAWGVVLTGCVYGYKIKQ